MSSVVSAAEILTDASQLLHGVDPIARQLVFRPTSEQNLRDAGFIDGRTEIWTGAPVTLPFSASSEWASAGLSRQRYIFHMSFCGSTLLARLLDRPGKALALREPNCLADLANWRTALASASNDSGDFNPVLRLAGAMLARTWTAGEQVVVKPSSWANNLIGELIASSEDTRSVFVTIARDRFLEAVLRGGNDRLAFAARLAAHLSPFVEGGSAALHVAIESTDDAIGKATRLALVAHHNERRLFQTALGEGSSANGTIDLEEIEADPERAAGLATSLLDLPLDRSDIQANCARWTRAHAKAEGSYSGDLRRSENEQVRAHFGELIDSALEWADRALPK